MDSSKIKKEIRGIIFVSENKTVITFGQKFTPHQHNHAVKEIKAHKSDMERHYDFNDAMQKMAVHALIRGQWIEPLDRLGCSIEAPYFTDHIYLDDDRLKGIKVTGVIFTNKDDTTGFQILYNKVTTDGAIQKVKSPPISTIKLADGENVYNYPLIVFAEEHVDTLY